MTNTLTTIVTALALSLSLACGGGSGADLEKACENLCDCIAPGDDECIDTCEEDEESSNRCIACVANADSCREIGECDDECD